MSTPLPDEFFVYVTTDNPVVLWNLSLGRISSASIPLTPEAASAYESQEDRYLPYVINPDFNGAYSWQLMRTTASWRVEYGAETCRIRNFRNRPSRLGCLFAWGSLEEARAAEDIVGRRYRERPLKRCRIAAASRVLRANSAVVAFVKHVEEFLPGSPDFTEHAWSVYWSGSDERLSVTWPSLPPTGEPKKIEARSEPVWEWLIDGALDVIEDVPARD
jgi:hypothetical protein